MSNFNQELKEILPINSEEKLDALFKLLSRRHTVITTYIDIAIFKYLTDTNLRNTYCIRTGRTLSNVLFNIEAIEKKREKKASQKETDNKKAKVNSERKPAKETYTQRPAVPVRRPAAPESVYRQGKIKHTPIGHGYVPEGPRLQKNKGVSSLQFDMSKAIAIMNSVSAVDKISPEQRASAESYRPKPEETKKKGTSVPQNSGSENKTTTAAEKSKKPESITSATSSNKEKETLIEIVGELKACETARDKVGIFAIARVHCIYDGKPNNFWFTSRLYAPREMSSLNGFGRFVPKYSDVAIRMQKSEVGTSFDYATINKIKRLESHTVLLENQSNLQNHTISIAGDKLTYQYRNLADFLHSLRKNQQNIREIEARLNDLEEKKKGSTSRSEQTKNNASIAELQKEYRILTEQQEDLKNITIYIRKQGEMRYSYVVDPIQTGIMEKHLYDGKTVVIQGGPGTGKTTTMIHRLAYLTNIYAIDEDEKNRINKYKLSTLQRKQLREAIKNHCDWMFFSPSVLLKDYLADAMEKEGLTHVSEKVRNWTDYCRMILQEDYNLLETSYSKAPFKVCYSTETLFYQGFNVVKAFTDFYLDQWRNVKYELPQLNTDGVIYEWTAIAQNIKNRFDNASEFELNHFVILFNSLESVYGNDCKKLLNERNNTIGELAEKICSLIDQDSKAKNELKIFFDLTSDDVLDAAKEDDDDFTYMEEEEETEDPGIIRSAIQKVIKPLLGNKPKPHEMSLPIQKWLKAYCYTKVNEGKKLSDEQALIADVLLPIIENQFDTEIKKIGELMIFEQFAQYTRGIRAIMLNGIPARYKKFRAYLNKSKVEGCNLPLLRDLIQNKQGRELHFQEQSLLLGFINTLVKQIKISTNKLISHVYVEAYEEAARPIIGIDEATDFSICEIYAMQSLLKIEFNSLTLCGDRMQRITDCGIKTWEELESVVPNPVPFEMVKSYRQSTKVLEVAKKLCIDSLGETPNYKAFMTSKKVPAPLIYIDEDESEKIIWISERIAEVFRAYGDNLPSIAIFVTDKGYIPRFMERLQDTVFFKTKKIKVLDGTDKETVSDKHICVYPINIVKGMEFDVVFFHNIDKFNNDDILKRYIYVGVSRAAFFLGVTMVQEKEEISKYFVKDKDWFKI